MDSKKKKMLRFDVVMISELVSGDRFHFQGKKDSVFTFQYYSESEKGHVYFKDGDYKEKIRKRDLSVVFLRNTSKR